MRAEEEEGKLRVESDIASELMLPAMEEVCAWNIVRLVATAVVVVSGRSKFFFVLGLQTAGWDWCWCWSDRLLQAGGLTGTVILLVLLLPSSSSSS